MIGHINLDDLFALGENCHVYLVDKQGKLLRSNDVFIDLFIKNSGYDKSSYIGPDSIIGKTIAELFPPTEEKVIMAENKLVMGSGKTQQFINFVYNKNNPSITFYTLKTPYYSPEGEIIGVFGISTYLSIYEPPKDCFTPLSERERECLGLLMKGNSATNISEKLSLSKRTVETYIENIKDKLGCQSKLDIIDLVFKLGFDAVAQNTFSKSIPFSPGIFFVKGRAKHDAE